MKPEAQRIAIATAAGWSQIKNMNSMAGIWVGYPPKNAIVGRPEHLPDYLNDLNAMNEAEKTLQKKLKFWPDYICELRDVMKIELMGLELKQMMSDEHAIYRCINSTAAQRAEAFLKTIGKWQPNDDVSCEKTT